MVLAVLRAMPGVIDAVPADTAEGYLVEVAPGHFAAADLARAVVGQGFALSGLTEAKPDLEHVFLGLTRQTAMMPANAA
jgi:hypothetical protein